jgi:WD40 repeat protein
MARIVSMDVHPLAPYLIATSLDYVLRVWNLKTQKMESTIDLTHEKGVLVSVFDPSRLAFAVGTYKTE